MSYMIATVAHSSPELVLIFHIPTPDLGLDRDIDHNLKTE